MNWKVFVSSAFAATTFVMMPGSALAVNLVQNGGFETVDTGAANGSGAGYWTYIAGNTGIDSWKVGMTSVDIVETPYPTYGSKAVDLVGTPGPGSIQQTLQTVAGEDYEVTFQLYWTGDPINKEINASLGSQQLLNLSLNPSGTWLTFNLTFINVEANAELRLWSNPQNGGNGNTFIDNIEVTAAPVPEPVTMVLGAAALGLAARRRRRAH